MRGVIAGIFRKLNPYSCRARIQDLECRRIRLLRRNFSFYPKIPKAANIS